MKLEFTENSTFLSSFLEISNTIDVGNRLPIAMDYVGDTLVAGWFGTVDGAPAGNLRIEGINGNAFVEWHAFTDPASMCFAYDARYNAAIINTTILAGGLVGSNELRIFIRGTLEGFSSWAGQSGYPVGYLGWGVNFNIAYGPQWIEVNGHPDTVPSLAINDSQFVAGVWHGSAPGSPHGTTPPFTAAVGFHTLAREFRSSFADLSEGLEVPSGWFNFAGAC
jgi:hypothetical protein